MDDEAIKIKTKEAFLNHLGSERSYGSVSRACNLIGRSRQAIYDWRKSDAEFNNAVVDAVITGKSLLADLAEEGLVERIKARDTTAIIFTLKNLRKEHYGDKEEKKENKEEVVEGNDAVGVAPPKSPREVVLLSYLLHRHYRYRVEKYDLLTDDIAKMFNEQEAILEKYKNMLE